MTVSKSPLLLAAMAAVGFNAAIAAPLPANSNSVSIPNHSLFFPTESNVASIPSQLSGIQSLNSVQRNYTPAPTPIPDALPVAKAAASSANIFGYLYYSPNESVLQGYYRVDPAKTSTFLWQDEYTEWGMPMLGGWLRDGRVCGLNGMKFMGGLLAYCYIEMDRNTGKVLELKQIPVVADDMVRLFLTPAYRDLDDRVYGYGYDAEGVGFSFTYAPSDRIEEAVSIMSVEANDVCTSLCYNIQDDLFYGVTMDGRFVSVDCNGQQTEIFTINLPNRATYITGLVYSPVDKKYIWNVYFTNATSAIYAIDPDAKTVTKLSSCPNAEEYIYMVTTDDNVSNDAPATPVLDSYSFVNGSMSGSATYSMPSRLYGGGTISGNLDWRILVDGLDLSSGTAPAGSKVPVVLDNLENGYHTFAFDVQNSAGRSLPVIFRTWIGTDYPVAPQNLVLTHTNLTWDPVKESIHDGYVDYSAIKYTVYLNDELIGETSSTSMPITLPAGKPFTSYTATVVATAADGKASDAGVSNFVTYGDPLALDIHFRPEEKELELMTLINLDGRKSEETGKDLTWFYTEEMGFPSFASGYLGDDWLILPPIAFETTDKAYLFSMESGLTHDSDNTGTIEVWFGEAPTAEAMTRQIIPPTRQYYMRPEVLKEYFSVSKPGTYYIGIRAKTGKVSFHVSDIDISKTDKNPDLPLGVSNLDAVADSEGELTAKVSFDLPVKTASGKDIPQSTDIDVTVRTYSTVIGQANSNELVATYTLKGKPGSHQTLDVQTAQNYNYINVICSIDGSQSKEESILIYTGQVIPYVVQNLTSEVSEDNMSVKLSWTPPVEGEEEGPIGSNFMYYVYYYNNGWEYGDQVGENVLEYTYNLPQGTEQQWIRLGIMAANYAGLSEHIVAVTDVVGTPYSLPMVETYPDYMETYEPTQILRPSEEYEGTYWMMDDPAEVSPLFKNSTNCAMIGFTESYTNVKARVALPKFSTDGKKDVKFTFNYWGGRYGAKFHLLGMTYGLEQPVAIADLPSASGWTSYTVQLPAALEGKKWVAIYVDADITDNQTFAMFSGYSITGTTGINDIDADSQGSISASHGILTVAGFKGQQLIVSDLAGRTVVAVDALDDVNAYTLASGLYIVRAGSQTQKITIR